MATEANYLVTFRAAPRGGDEWIALTTKAAPIDIGRTRWQVSTKLPQQLGAAWDADANVIEYEDTTDVGLAAIRAAHADAEKWRTTCVELEKRIYEMTVRERQLVDEIAALLARLREVEGAQ